MPYPLEEASSAPVSELPKPELNPMMNPMLGRNLGRWAQAYFTSPPEKREEAVTELLRELESETSDKPAVSQPAPTSAARIQEREQIIKQFFGTSESVSEAAEPEHFSSNVTGQSSAPPAELSCPGCSYTNSMDQQYCGHCGFPLSGQTRVISTEPPTHRHTPAPSHDDTQWLRERALNSFEQYEAPSGGGLKYVILIFLILFAGFAYMRWVQSRQPVATVSKPASDRGTAVPRPDPVTPAAEPARSRSEGSVDSKPGQVIKQNPAAANTANPPAKQNPVPAALRSKEKETDTKSADASPADAASQASYQDVLLAQQYLEGRIGSRNAPQAAQLLWRAVARQNSDAAVLLSNLYAQGDGVPKSCDQARLLLVAAAKKGSAQAAQQLRTFYSHACR